MEGGSGALGGEQKALALVLTKIIISEMTKDGYIFLPSQCQSVYPKRLFKKSLADLFQTVRLMRLKSDFGTLDSS